MLSTVDTSAMWDEFRRVRAQTLGQLPLPLDPALIVAYENGSYPTTSTNLDQLQADPAPARVSIATVSADDSNVNTAADGASDESCQWVDGHGKAVLGLLGAIFVVCVVCAALLVATVMILVRRKRDY